MRVAFISDIHGNAIALDAVLNDINKKKVDQIYVLGDICFRGPEPLKSLERIRALNGKMLKGNADEWVVRGIREGEVPDSAFDMMSMERDWTVRQLDMESIQYLSSLPTELKLEIGNLKIHAFHATPSSLFEMVQPFESDEDLTEKMMKSDSDLYIYAHIHKPYIRYLDGKCIINTGSVGLPFDGTTKSSYVLLEIADKGFQTAIVRVEYDVEKVVKQFEEAGYPNSDQLISIVQNGSI